MFEREIDFLGGKTPASLMKDLRRLVGNRQFEFDDNGLMVFKNDVDIQVGGIFDSEVLRHDLVQQAVNDGDKEREAWLRRWARASGALARRDGYHAQQAGSDHNLIPDAGINAILGIIFGATTKISTWYQGPFTSNSTPGAAWGSNWAGATSGPLATELAEAAYDESNRQAAVFGSAAAKSIATSSATTFTIASGQSGLSLYGSTLNNIATVAYDATDRVLMAATRFSSAKSGLGEADVVNISYTISGSST
ncbi:MAG: hypothetical protein WBG92_19415 [Thiohalocapsa sp.]